ncbi:MAG: HEAT repeat domain-containing protein [Nitrospirota bacterium]|nr:MAG: HEAT repeat domain-containing protein [Nitrospirota bacterium]
MEADSIQIAKEVLQTLIKSKKNLRMYPENNPIYIKTIEAAHKTFEDLLDYTDDIVFKVKQLEILYDGEQVYYKPDKEDNLALFFFKDGIREITFKRGLDKVELEDFLKIIMQDLDSEEDDDDVVTLMWERDFQYISYIVDETFLSDEEDYEEKAVQQAKDNSADEDDLLKAYNEMSGAEDASVVPVVPLNEDDIKKLQTELDRDTGYYIDKLTDLLFEMLHLSEKKGELQDLVSFFRSAIDFALQNNHIDLAVNILKRTRLIMTAEMTEQKMKSLLKLVMSYINSDRVITLLGELLDSRTEDDEEISNELFPLMDISAIPALIKTLGELETIHARKIMINSLIILGKRDLVAVAKGLNDKRWFVVRNIILVLKSIKDKRAVEFLKKKLRHTDIRVRKEVIKALGYLGGAEVVNGLRSFLLDSDPAVRGLTAKALAATASPLAKRVLQDEIMSKAFKGKDLSEKKEFFEAAASWKDRDMINYFIKILRKKPFFGRGKLNEVRACSAYALGLTGQKDVIDILAKFKNEKNALIRDNVRMAVMRLEHGVPERTK